MDHNHTEAFALMWYACECGHRERIWNSRDGVTPFGGVSCPSCGSKGMQGGLTHVDWQLDQFAPDHKLADGQRFFRDGAADDAVRIIERRVSLFAERGKPVPADIAERLRANAREQSGEWQPGWPMVDRYAEPQS